MRASIGHQRGFGFMVQMEAITGHPDIVEYRANATAGSSTHSCTVEVESDPLSCWIGGLSPATVYAVSVVACLLGSAGCGPPGLIEGITYPSRKFINNILYFNTPYKTFANICRPYSLCYACYIYT